jgi:hypothetical protein
MEDKKIKQPSNLLRYSSMGIELVVLLCAAAWLGRWLDAKYGIEKGLFTIFLMLFAVVGSMYRLIKSLLNDQNKK